MCLVTHLSYQQPYKYTHTTHITLFIYHHHHHHPTDIILLINGMSNVPGHVKQGEDFIDFIGDADKLKKNANYM